MTHCIIVNILASAANWELATSAASPATTATLSATALPVTAAVNQHVGDVTTLSTR